MRQYAHARWLWALLMLISAGVLGTNCPPCPSPPVFCVFQSESDRGSCHYTINNNTKADFILETMENDFKIQCPNNVMLDDPSLPVLEYSALVIKATTVNCGVPKIPYSQALARLNITVVDSLSLERLPPAKLHGDHFAGLNRIKTLLIYAQDTDRPLQADGALLNPLLSLTKLDIFGVILPNVTLEEPPQHLEELKLTQCGIGALPETALRLMPKLTFLIFDDKVLEEPPNATLVPNLRKLTIGSPRLKRAPPLANITDLTLEQIQDVRLEGKCESLRDLTIRSEFITALPEKWISNCQQLINVTLQLKNLTYIPENAFENATILISLKLTDSKYLNPLPARLFQDTRELIELDLSRNNLTSLPRGIFSLLTKLKSLKLCRNNLGHGISPMDALQPLDALTSLTTLYLDRNPLGDLCAVSKKSANQQQMSPLSNLLALQNLFLAETGIVHICQDWREKLSQLQHIDLSDNKIEEIKAIDLQWAPRDTKVTVVLLNNTLKSMILSSSEVASLHVKKSTVLFETDAVMSCDCNMYWFNKAMKTGKLGAEFRTISCAVRRPRRNLKIQLRYFPEKKMVCHIKHGCPNSCDCILKPENETLLVECQKRGLKHFPDLSRLPNKIRTELNVSNNLIASVPSVIPSAVMVLDIRYNKLNEFNKSTVESLVAGFREVWMKGNELSCSCSDYLPRRLYAPGAAAKIKDFDTVRCSDGRSLQQATRDGCMALRGITWGLGGAALALMITAAVLIALKRAVRLRLKAYLLARGLCVRWVKPDDDDDCIYDAFISFSHQDREYVEVLIAELESGPRPMKLCIHDRDWPVGGWIPAQIASSVAQSRRTVILLSKNFMESFWARVEFREAYARAILETKIRLIVVLLDDEPPEGLDDELQHYVSNNTYVKWAESAFWEKLRTALPEPRPVPKKTKKRKKKTKQTPIPMPAPSSDHHPPNVLVVPNPTPVSNTQSPSTPIVKFSQIDFPAPIKPAKLEACPCA